MLPTVDFCGMEVTRLIIGANPFGGFSHQNRDRDKEMVAFNTPEIIKETWERAWKAGINTMITNNETPHVVKTTAEYLAEGGTLQWIAQINCHTCPDMNVAIDKCIEIGCKAGYLHGGFVDNLYKTKDEKALREHIKHGQAQGIPMGVAAHSPDVHYWVDSLDLVDFHVVCFFNCGSLHSGKGDKFKLADIFPAVECIKSIKKPCIGYKIMGAGRIDPLMSFEFAFENIKPTDVVNVGMHRGDKDDMVEENVNIVRRILEG
ncbi:hypothetical protein GF312_22530 [Candidatus Poribacteria bacterium]|nr:hypothetical protein [Candidatus Poribacteria bacterium]